MASLLESGLLAWISNFSSAFLPANNFADIKDGNIISYVIHTILENAPAQDFVPFSNNSSIGLKENFTNILERLSDYMFDHLSILATSKKELFNCLCSNIDIDSIAQTGCSMPLVKILEVLLAISVQSPTKERSILGILQLPKDYQRCLINSIQNTISVYQKKSHKICTDNLIDENVDYKSKIKELQTDLLKLQQAYKAVCLENDQKKNENTELKKKIHELESDSIEIQKLENNPIECWIRRESEIHKQKLHRIKEVNMLNELDIVVKTLQRENELLKLAAKQNESALLSYSKRVDELSVYVMRSKMLEDELEIMKEKISVNKELEKSVQRLEAKVHTANEYIKQLETARDQYEKKIAELSAINKQEASLKSNSERLKYDLSRLTQKLIDAENAIKEKDLQLTKLKEKLESVMKSERVYKTIAEQSKSIHQHSNSFSQQLKTDLEKMNTESAHQYQSTLEDTLQGYCNLELKPIDAKKLYLSLKVVTRQVEAEALERMHAGNEDVDLKVTEMRKITQNVLSLIKQEKLVQEEKKKIQQELACVIQNHESINKENTEYQQRLSCLVQERDSIKKEITQLQEELSCAIQKQESTDKDNLKLQQRLSCLVQERDSMEKEVKKLQEELSCAIQKQESTDKDNSELRQKLTYLTQERDHANFELVCVNQEKKEKDKHLSQIQSRNKAIQQKVNTQSVCILLLYSMLLKAHGFKKLAEEQKNQLVSKENRICELLKEKKDLSVQLVDQDERFNTFLNEKAILKQNFEKELEILKNNFEQRMEESRKTGEIEALKKKIQEQRKQLEHQNIELNLAQDSLHQMGLKLYEQNLKIPLDLYEQKQQSPPPFESSIQKCTSVCIETQLNDVKNIHNADVNLPTKGKDTLHDKTKPDLLKKSTADRVFKSNRITLAEKALMPRPSYQQVL